MTEKITVQENVRFAPLTTMKIGGEARFFVRAESEDEIVQALEFARENLLEVFVLGGGSNLLVADAGFDGVVLQISLKSITENGGEITAAAGEDWDAFVAHCVGKNLAGLECLSGIPGFVGATPIQNVGAYGQEVSETVTAVRVLDRETGEIKTMSNAECQFAYRSSIFNTTHKGRFIVLAVTFSLTENDEPSLRYADIKKYFEGEINPSLADVRRAVIEIRARKSMVIDPADPNSKSAGSFFKNPIVSTEQFQDIAENFDGDVPNFPAGDDKVKIPAAWLIEKSGFQKGYIKGSAGLSENHTLALINRGDAKASDILALKEEIQEKVRSKFGVDLHPEPIFVGFDK